MLIFHFSDEEIDGKVLFDLTYDDIIKLLSEVKNDGTIKLPTIGTRHRFQALLKEYKEKRNSGRETNGK